MVAGPPTGNIEFSLHRSIEQTPPLVQQRAAIDSQLREGVDDGYLRKPHKLASVWVDQEQLLHHSIWCRRAWGTRYNNAGTNLTVLWIRRGIKKWGPGDDMSVTRDFDGDTQKIK